jgi:hypothetical protein
VKSSIIKALIIALFLSFISIGGAGVNTYAQQKDGDHKEKIETPGQKPLPKHKGGKRHKHKHKKKHHKKHKKHHKKHHKHGKKNKKNKDGKKNKNDKK